MSRHLLVLVTAVWLATGAATAEVRLVRDGSGQPRLDVRASATGVWTPRGIVDSAVVNPRGDVLGDGYPASATKQGSLLAAWVRPASDSLVLFRADANGNRRETLLEEPGPVGVPLVAPTGDGWFVAWSTVAADPHVSVAVATTDGESPPASVLPGRLVALVPIADAVHVLSYEVASGELHVATFVLMHLPHPIPVPIPTTRAIIDLRLSNHWPQPIPIPIANSDTTTAWSPCIEVRADDALVAWSARDHQVGSIVLDELGVVDAAPFVRGPSGSCTAVLNAAGRQ